MKKQAFIDLILKHKDMLHPQWDNISVDGRRYIAVNVDKLAETLEQRWKEIGNIGTLPEELQETARQLVEILEPLSIIERSEVIQITLTKLEKRI